MRGVSATEDRIFVAGAFLPNTLGMIGRVNFSLVLRLSYPSHVRCVASCRLEVPPFLFLAAAFTSSRKGIRFVEARFSVCNVGPRRIIFFCLKSLRLSIVESPAFVVNVSCLSFFRSEVLFEAVVLCWTLATICIWRICTDSHGNPLGVYLTYTLSDLSPVLSPPSLVAVTGLPAFKKPKVMPDGHRPISSALIIAVLSTPDAAFPLPVPPRDGTTWSGAAHASDFVREALVGVAASNATRAGEASTAWVRGGR
jgi:hypothetical protein